MALGGLSRPAQGHVAMLTFSALIGGSFSFGSLIANRIDPVALTIARFAIALVLIGALAALRPGFRRSDFRAPWRYAVMGGLMATYFIMMFEGLKTATPVSTAAVFTLTPILSAGFAWLLLRQKITHRIALSLAIGGAGALWVIFRADLLALLAMRVGRGEAIFFIGVAAHALYTPLIRKFNRGESPLVFTFGMMLGAIVVMMVYDGRSLLHTDWTALTVLDWAVIVYLAVFTGAVTSVLVQFSSMRLPAAKVMAYGYLVPSWVIVFEVCLGRGLPPVLVLVGICLTLAALALLLKDEGDGTTALVR